MPQDIFLQNPDIQRQFRNLLLNKFKEPKKTDDSLPSEKIHLDILRQTIDYSQPTLLVEQLVQNCATRLKEIKIIMYRVMERYVQHISDHEDDTKTIKLLEEHFTALQLESDFLLQK